MSSDIKSVKGPHQVSTHAATALKSGKDNRLCSVVSVCPVHPRSVTALYSCLCGLVHHAELTLSAFPWDPGGLSSRKGPAACGLCDGPSTRC